VFAVATAFGSGCNFNAGYSVNKVLMPSSEWLDERGGGTFGKLMVHAENARLHKARISQQFRVKDGMRMATHRPYSPDLALSDFLVFFYLFIHVKDLLRRESFERGEDLLSAVEVILGTLEKPTLSQVFLEWMTRPE
jgi:hypothetical protein